MTKRFNYKQLEMQMEDLAQEVMAKAVRSQGIKSSMATFDVSTRGSMKLITVMSIAEFDVEDFQAVYGGFTVFETSGGLDYNYHGCSVEGVRGSISKIIRDFRNQPEQIRWMEQRVLEMSVIDNGITTKTRRL